MITPIALVAALLLAPGRVHPEPATFGEAFHDRDMGRLEFQIELPALDLEFALREDSDEKIPLDRITPRIEKRCRAYVEARFSVTSPAGEKVALRWVGLELDRGNAWVYFDAPVAAEVEGYRFASRLLGDGGRDWTNELTVSSGRRRATLTFGADATERTLKFPAPKPKSKDPLPARD
ncbi:MAG: DUF6702 family protein [Planctomycetota bacterium]